MLACNLLVVASLVLCVSSELITITQHPSACSASYTTTFSTITSTLSTDPSTSTRDPLPDFGEEEVSGPRLPYRLDVQFGGVDATQALNNGTAKNPSLFRLTGLNENEYNYTDVTWSFGTTNYDESFKVPYFLSFDWSSNFECKEVKGETKAAYHSQLSIALGGNAAFDGFGIEMKETFAENDYVETYKKYASLYCRYDRYTVSIIEDNFADLQQFLTPQALKVFREQNAEKIVGTFGTHYMRSATFGGVKRFASKIDVRDEGIAEDLGSALGFSVAETETGGNDTSGKKAPDSAGFNFNLDTKTKSDIHRQMETSEIQVIGGNYVEGEESQWVGRRLAKCSNMLISPGLLPISQPFNNQCRPSTLK